jgi:prepilin-type N-terminal cleavage/methylation domain-containing protein
MTNNCHKYNSANSLKKAFSLIELSVVLIVVAILVTAVMQSNFLVSLSRLGSAKSLTNQAIENNSQSLVAWYETSSDIALVKGENNENFSITKWHNINSQNRSSGSNDLTSVNVKYKKEGISNLPSLQLQGDSKLFINNLKQGKLIQATIFMVFSPNFSSSNQMTIFDSANSANQTAVLISQSLLNGNSGDQLKPYVVAFYLNGENSKFFVNNFQNSSNFNAGTNLINGAVIGNNSNANNGFHGLISEVIIFDSPLKLEARQNIFNYLAKKYNIAIT